jgi:CHAT domain-containing protein
VIVTLWAIRDLSAALLMSEFHRRRSVGEDDATALRSAIRYLRRLSPDEADALFEHAATAAAAAGRKAVAATADAARDVVRQSASAPFSHPLHWAAFELIST